MAKNDFTSFATEHPNYFPGQYLLDEDFKLQHKYHSDRLRYQNQSLHVSGIIEGLEVVVSEDKKSVLIKSGSAIDSNGNLIVLKEEQTFSEFKNITDGEFYIQHDDKLDVKQEKDVDLSYSWNECYENEDSFCHKLTEKLKSQGNWEFRLPSEAEWEYTCRAKTTTTYYFGDNEDDLSDYAWYNGNSENTTHPVGQKKPNNFGLYDMYGNVQELCEDNYHFNYIDAPTDGSAWLELPREYNAIVRGGAWNHPPSDGRSASRSYENLDSRYGSLGLRVVCAAPRTQ